MSNRQHADPGPPQSDAPQVSLAERARTLAAAGRIGTLCTHSLKFPGYPFGSMMPYAVDDQGRPVFFISSMAMHTQNLYGDARSSLLITPPETPTDPLGAPRLTLVGKAGEAARAEVRDLYLGRHENARLWQDFSDFAFYRLEVEGLYFIGGFGVMGWVTADEYRAAAPDPLMDDAPGIMAHMNSDHADTLVAIARHFAGEAADQAMMTDVDRLGFQLRLMTGDRVHGTRVAFLREVRSRDDARQVLIEMARRARSRV